MHNSIFAFATLKRSILITLPLLLAFSCQEWTPMADGYYVVDGKRYNVHIMAVYGAAFPSQSANNIEVTLQGAPSFNVTMFLTSPGNTLAAGDYHVSWGYELRGINSLNVRYGGSEFSANQSSVGNMTVETSGNHYIMDFDGNIQGHKVQIHYSGLIARQ